MYTSGDSVSERLRAEYKSWPTVPGEATLEKIEELIMEAYGIGFQEGYNEH